ncbi:uncharacterized protein AC631_00799 [Debaryomyces fabryi]|uniref:PWWP domain-containing protein n=1 Tax=Debaryomyces fabryi TaxID=58627 RepID=A0A0V1Q4P4_9ASCO|nr:uncharacterized protein AC631_00799 [Debaryomyces fabryi]KSA03483.1 hypothetical protein AC631_00799 [Debaryomyces fabryi]CUM53650.1 unnamed protein product [Debaryomyces fabryi]
MSSDTPTPSELLKNIETPEVTSPHEKEAHQKEPENDNPYPPKSIVLAKVKGYPPWPAMILDEALLPENIRSKKPKSVKQPPKRKLSKPITILPVRFFSDDTYIWIKSNELKTLNHEMINLFLQNDKKRKDNLLQTAYELANDPPDMELFIKWGSKGEPVEVPYVPEEEVVEEEEEDVDDIEEEDVEEEEEEEEDYEEPSRKKQKKNTKQLKSKKKTTKKQPAKKETKPTAIPKAKQVDPREQGYDSDWGLDEVKHYNYDEGNYIFDKEKDQIKFETEFPSAASLSNSLAKYHNQFDKLDILLTDQLLSDPINETEILQNLKKLDGLTIPKSVYTKSKVLKALILTLRRPSERFPYPKIKKEVKKLVRKWVDLDIEENTIEDLEMIEENGETTQEPEQLPDEESKQEPEQPNAQTAPDALQGEHQTSGASATEQPELATATQETPENTQGASSEPNGVKSDSFNTDSFVTA